jgi:NAD(P)-dependent dehydrogenase (short-subunit alcohol dehydrogenase family)
MLTLWNVTPVIFMRASLEACRDRSAPPAARGPAGTRGVRAVACAAVGRLEGRRALVTGASRGIGRAIATAFAGEGAAVALLARDAAALEALAAELGPAAVACPADVADPVAVDTAVARAADALHGLDAVVNAAAVDCVWAPVGEMPVESWQRTIAVNLSGTFYVCRASLPHLVAAGGAIVNVTSVAGLRAWKLDSAYNAAKAGVELLTRTIAVEYGGQGVRANCVAPGVIDAGMTDAVTDPVERADLVGLHPAARLGRAEEVAEACVWLCAGATFTTGATLTVDGGFLA